MSQTPAHSQPRPSVPPKRRHLRIVGLLAVVLVLIAVVGYWFVFSPSRIAAMAERAIGDIIGGEVYIGFAKLDLSGELDLNNIRVRAPGMQGEAAEVFHADRIVLNIDRSSLWFGRFAFNDIKLVRPTITLAEDAATGQLNFMLLAPRSGAGTIPGQLPRIAVEQARYRCVVWRNNQLETIGQIDVAGHMVNDANNPSQFNLSLIELRGGRPYPDGLGVTGIFDVAQGTGQAQLIGLGFEERIRRLLPRPARELWDAMEPGGVLPKIDFTVDPQHGARAVVSFTDVELTLPPLTEANYRFRMTGVKGAFRFQSDKVEIVEDLVGQIEGLEYRIAGTLDGYAVDAPFRFAMQTEPLTVPAEPRFIYALPEPVQKVFRMLTPEGRMRVSMAVFRDQSGGAVDYQGTATILSGKGRYSKFPYILDNCRGTINFNQKRIDILSLTGDTSGGGSATISGVISPPGDDPAVDLVITAVNIPFDETLYEAFEPEHRQALDMFFHRESYQRLRDSGHFIEVAEYNADELAAAQIRRKLITLADSSDHQQQILLQLELDRLNQRLTKPAFDLGGRANIIINVTRLQGPGEDKTIEADVDLQEASIIFKFFPYPLHVTGGRLHIVPGRVEFQDIVGEGLLGGAGGLSGFVTFPERGKGIVTPQVQIYLTDLPIDDALFDALPQPQDQWVRGLHAAGSMSVSGRIFADAQHKPAIDLMIDLQNVTAAPGSGKFPLTDVQGRLRLTLRELQIHEIVGNHNDGRITFTGNADWRQSENPTIDLHADIAGFRFEEPVEELFAPFADFSTGGLTFLQNRNLTGVYDAEVQYQRRSADDKDLRIDLHPRSITLDHHDSRFSFTNMKGSLRLEGDQLTLDGLSGDFDGGKITTDGLVTLKPHPVAELTADISGNGFTDSLRNMLPQAVGRLLQSAKLDGKYQIHLDPVIFRAEAPDGVPQTQFIAHVELADASAHPGVKVDQINAKFNVDVQKVTGEQWPRLNVAVETASFNIFGRMITDLRARLHSDVERGSLLMPVMHGRIYGGSIGGIGAVALDDQEYSFQLALADVDLAKLMYENQPSPVDPQPKTSDKKHQPMVGRLAAAFDFVGQWNDPDKLRGRGDVQIRNGRMYDLPLSIGLLQITHLTLPVTRSFERAAISYYIQKGGVTFDRITLESQHMRLAGEGTMNYRTRELDLTLTSSNPSAIDLGPISDMVNVIRDQFVTIRVTGTAEDPQTHVQQLTGVTEAWRDVFGSREEQER